MDYEPDFEELVPSLLSITSMEQTTLPLELVAGCEQALFASAADLMALAVERGGRHYAPIVAGHVAPDAIRSLRHEVLGCALLRFPMPDGFDAFRCGVMVLSDRGNDADIVVSAAEYLGVAARLGYVAGFGVVEDVLGRDYWAVLRSRVPAEKDDQLPGVSRFISETHMVSGRRCVSKVWLRTTFRP